MRIDNSNIITSKPELLELLKNLKVGDSVKGRVLEAINGLVTLKTPTGQNLTASLLTDIQLIKGSFVELMITNMADGKIFAELKGKTAGTQNIDSKIGELLAKNNIPVNENNIEIAKTLLKYNLPADKENLMQVIGMQKNAASLAGSSNEGALGIMLSGVNIDEMPVDILNKISLATESVVKSKLQEEGKSLEIPNDTAAADENTAEINTDSKGKNIAEQVTTKAIKAEADKKSAVLEANLDKVLKDLGVDTKNSDIKNLLNTVLKAVKTADKTSVESIVYLLSKDMEVNPKNLDLLEKNINNENKLSAFLDKLEEQINTHDNKELAEVKDSIKKIFVKPQQLEDKEEIKEQLKEVIKLGEKLENILAKSEVKDTEIKTTLTNLRDNIDFIKNINEFNNYLQIPVTINGKNTTADIYVFKDGKKGKTIDPQNATVLLALDLKYVGHLESMINVNQKAVNITFRMEDKKTGELFTKNADQLQLSLEARGYKLNPIKIIKLDQSFNLISLEKVINEGNKEKMHFDIKI